MTPSLSTRQLNAGDERVANELFELISDVFEVPCERLDDIYVEQLLAQPTFRCYVSFVDGHLAGGLTAHILPMTRSMSSEMFIYDVAVRPAYQRRGVGTALVRAALDDATRDSIGATFVPADNDDKHALAFYEALGGEASPVTFFTFESSTQRA
jgi:aminoglycoside 3-N-acetyltransferase I